MTSNLIATVEQEGQDLQLHVDLCAQRYYQLLEKFHEVDNRLSNIESMMVEIKDSLTSTRSDTYRTYLGWAGVVIVALLGAVIHLVTK
jgi:septation ring formation regulator EzrA